MRMKAPELPVVMLSMPDQDDLRQLKDDVVQQTIEQFEELLTNRQRQVDTAQWKELRRKEGLRVYKERPVRRRRMSFAVKTPNDEDALGPQTLLLNGTLEGSLDDIMYSVMASTEESMKVRAKCMEDTLIDAKVVFPIAEPTADDPMRHLAVKWCLHTHSFTMPARTEPRDYVGIEATGVLTKHPLTDSRIGYHLFHSIDVSEFPLFDDLGIQRTNMSVCAIYKERSPTQVECFVRGFFDFPSDDLVMHVIANQWLFSMTRECEYARTKKLIWWLRNATSGVIKQYKLEPEDPYTGCGLCGNRPSRASITQRLGFSSRRKHSCMGCHRMICSKCCVTKRLFVYNNDQQRVLDTKRLFCSKCVLEAGNCDALTIAQEEALLLLSQQSYQSSHPRWSAASVARSTTHCHPVPEADEDTPMLARSFT